MLLDEFLQVTPPNLFVLFGNKGLALLSVASLPGEWLEVEVPEEGFVLWVVEFHMILFWIFIVNYSLKVNMLAIKVFCSNIKLNIIQRQHSTNYEFLHNRQNDPCLLQHTINIVGDSLLHKLFSRILSLLNLHWKDCKHYL